MANELVKHQNLNSYLAMPAVATRLSEKLGLEESKKFTAALSSAVSTNPALLECEPGTVVNAGLIGHSLNLPPSPQLGYYYLVPYNNKKKQIKEAQFQIGYKGYIQLAMRSGYYKRLNVTEVKQGEFESWNPLTEEIEVHFLLDPIAREKAKTIGYCGYFEYVNGFKKMVYWTIQQIEIHADKYSKAYSLESDKLLKAGKIAKEEMWKYSSFWYSDFDGMAKKTVLRQLLSKWGSMSVDMQTAFEEDIKAETMTFTDAQKSAKETISDNAGKKPVDAEFSDQQNGEEELTPEEQAKKDKLNYDISKLKNSDEQQQPQELRYVCKCGHEFSKPTDKNLCPECLGNEYIDRREYYCAGCDGEFPKQKGNKCPKCGKALVKQAPKTPAATTASDNKDWTKEE